MVRYFLKKNYSTDYLQWLKVRESLPIKPSQQELEKLQFKIIEEKNAILAYYFAEDFNFKILRMQKVIQDTKNLKYALLFAQNIKYCNVKSLQHLILNSKKINYICKFACFVSGAELKPLEKIILNSKNPIYAYMLLKHNHINFYKIKKILMKSDNPNHLIELAKHLKNKKDIQIIEKKLIKFNDIKSLRIFAQKIKQANIKKIEKIILHSENIKEIKMFAKVIKNSDMKKFLIV